MARFRPVVSALPPVLSVVLCAVVGIASPLGAGRSGVDHRSGPVTAPAITSAADVTATTASPTAAATTAAPARTTTTTMTLDGVTVRLPAGGRQVVTVNHTSGHFARITLWQRDDGEWHVLARSTDGRIGYGGLVAARLRKQATGATPLGTFRLLWAFGRHPQAAAWKLPYRQIARGDYWVEDNASAYYNRYRNKAEGGFRWWLPLSDANSSERLLDYRIQYEYSIVIGFNYDNPVRHRGAGIFLHVEGPGATAGCVAGPRWWIRRAMADLDPTMRPVIAIGR
jgi:L,D-peptidoglycan transpeptidase YkuD (ErfK/YbiS/YcfS/YnhG family)